MQLVSSDGLPIATESRVEMWNAWRRGGCSTRGRFTENTHARVRVRMRTCAMHFTRCALLRVSPFLSASHVHVDFLFFSLASDTDTPIRIRLRGCLSFSFSLPLSLSRSFSSSCRSLLLTRARARARAWKRCHPSVERRAVAVSSFLFSSTSTSCQSSSWVLCSGFQPRLTVTRAEDESKCVPDDSWTRSVCKTMGFIHKWINRLD